MNKEKTYAILSLLRSHYPHAHMILEWGNKWELLVAIILSAQCTDLMVNKVTTHIFPKYKNPREKLLSLYSTYGTSSLLSQEEVIEMVNFGFFPLSELEEDIRSTGFYKNKAANIQKTAKTLLDMYQGVIPKTIAQLITLDGVGRKTANVFLINAYQITEGIAVDTHVTKQAKLLGLTSNSTPEKIEQDLMRLFDKKDWYDLTYTLIAQGRNKRAARAKQITCNDPQCILCT